MQTAAVMAQLAARRGRAAPPRSRFGGGEPTIRRSLLPLVRWCRDRGYRSIKVPSNGLMYSYTAYAEEACDAGINQFHISFMAHTDALYAQIMGKPGALRPGHPGRAQPAGARAQAGRRPDHQERHLDASRRHRRALGRPGRRHVQPVAGVAVRPQQGQPRLAPARHRDARRHHRRLRARQAARRHGPLAPHPALHAAAATRSTSPTCARTKCWWSPRAPRSRCGNRSISPNAYSPKCDGCRHQHGACLGVRWTTSSATAMRSCGRSMRRRWRPALRDAGGRRSVGALFVTNHAPRRRRSGALQGRPSPNSMRA